MYSVCGGQRTAFKGRLLPYHMGSKNLGHQVWQQVLLPAAPSHLSGGRVFDSQAFIIKF